MRHVDAEHYVMEACTRFSQLTKFKVTALTGNVTAAGYRTVDKPMTHAPETGV